MSQTQRPEDNKAHTLRWVRDAKSQLDTAQAEILTCVSHARRAGASWSEIGEALNMSKQAAQQKFGKLTPAPATTKVDAEVPAPAPNPVEQHHEAAAIFLDGTAPAKMAKGMSKKGKTPALDRMTTDARRTEYSILDSPFGWQVAVPEGAQPGTGKGPHACPGCGETNHKGITNHRPQFTADCTPTKYDPPYIAKFMKLVHAKEGTTK